jgi:hypothetical protein
VRRIIALLAARTRGVLVLELGRIEGEADAAFPAVAVARAAVVGKEQGAALPGLVERPLRLGIGAHGEVDGGVGRAAAHGHEEEGDDQDDLLLGVQSNLLGVRSRG